ncbi:MAG: UPF0147 family protein [Thermoplasmata archaeon]
MPKIDEDLNNILILLEDLIGDQSIPRNLRKSVNEAKERLNNKKEGLDLRVAGAIFILEELVNDPSLPIHARGSIFTIIGKLEALSSSLS